MSEILELQMEISRVGEVVEKSGKRKHLIQMLSVRRSRDDVEM